LHEKAGVIQRFIVYAIQKHKHCLVAQMEAIIDRFPFDPLNIDEYLILNFLKILIDCFWSFFSHTRVLILPTEHISGLRVLEH